MYTYTSLSGHVTLKLKVQRQILLFSGDGFVSLLVVQMVSLGGGRVRGNFENIQILAFKTFKYLKYFSLPLFCLVDGQGVVSGQVSENVSYNFYFDRVGSDQLTFIL